MCCQLDLATIAQLRDNGMDWLQFIYLHHRHMKLSNRIIR
jgi:hypothetical protein